MAFPEDVPRIESELRALAPTRSVVVIENRVYSGTGEVRWMQFVNRGFFDPDGQLQEIQSVGRDITDHKRAESEIAKLRNQYQTLFESIDEGFCIIEVLFDKKQNPVDYVFLTINPSLERQTGIKNAVGRRMKEIAPLHEKHWFDNYGKIALTGAPARCENSAEQLGRFYDVYAFRIGAPEERKVAILFQDITHRKQTEAALRHAEAQRLAEQRVVAERTRIARDLHDDLGNRLSEIQILAERLGSGDAVSAGEAALSEVS